MLRDVQKDKRTTEKPTTVDPARGEPAGENTKPTAYGVPLTGLSERDED